MAIDPTTGQYKPDDPTSVGQQLRGLLDVQSPYLKQAETSSMRMMNRRGLSNSSMAIQSGEAARIAAAVPIASQEASQAFQQGQQERAIVSDEKTKFASIASNDREKAASMATAMENSYAEAFRTIAQQPDLPADVRERYLTHLGAMRDSNLALVEQMYGLDLQWETPAVNPTTPPAAPAGGGGGGGTPGGGGSGAPGENPAS